MEKNTHPQNPSEKKKKRFMPSCLGTLSVPPLLFPCRFCWVAKNGHATWSKNNLRRVTNRYGYSDLLNMPLCPTNDINMANCVLLSMMKKMLKWLDTSSCSEDPMRAVCQTASFGVLICFLLRHLYFPTVMFAPVGKMEISKLIMDTKNFPNIWGLGFCECLRNGDSYNSQSIGIYFTTPPKLWHHTSTFWEVCRIRTASISIGSLIDAIYLLSLYFGMVSTCESTSKIHPKGQGVMGLLGVLEHAPPIKIKTGTCYSHFRNSWNIWTYGCFRK